MASITSLSNSSYNTSSIYGSRNVLSGLASGMDTESMIENAVSGIKMKIQNLYKQRTKVEWQQEAYRSIIDKSVNFLNKYTSYSSKTNLLSPSFFSNAVNTKTLGKYADKITASGKTSSDVKINSVKQLATAASYTVSGLGGLSSGEISGVTGGEFNIGADLDVSTVSGTLTIQYGGTNGTSFDISFDELENLNEMEGSTSAEKLANAINKKLSDISYTYTKNGYQETVSADKAIKVSVEGGEIKFSDGLGNGNKVTLSSASGKMKTAFGIDGSEEKTSLNVGNRALTSKTSTSAYLTGKTLGITFNGTTKSIDMSNVISKAKFTYDDDDAKRNEKFTEALQEELDKSFGAGKIKADYQDGKLSFTPSGKGDTLSLGGSAVKALGFSSGDSNFLNTSKKLGDLLGDKAGSIFTQANRLAGAGGATARTDASGSTYYLDKAGNRVDKDGYRVDSTGKALYDLQINDAHISITEDTTLESLMSSINSNADAGVKVSYSKLTNEFKFTASETGSNSKIEFGKLGTALFGSANSVSDKFADNYGLNLADGESKRVSIALPSGEFGFDVTNDTTMEDIAKKLNNSPYSALGYTASVNQLTGQLLVTDQTGKTVDIKASADGAELEPGFTSSYVTGQDAIMDVEINGKRFESFTRSSNSIDIDGLTVNLKGTFETEEGEDSVTFETTTDTDKIVDAIRDFVNDYNEMVTEIKSAYGTLPAQKSNGAKYEPLTSDDEDGMTESEIASYNEKAKQGILFGDSTLSSMYSKLLNAITPGGTDGQTLREIGIGTSYENGLTTISLDEDKLRSALESDPDKVKNAFTKTREGGSSSDGLMQTLQNSLNTYVKTTGEPKGVLITRAGSVKAPTSLNNNSLQTKINSIDTQIERWQTKMSNQIDRYTTKFSKLEQLIAEMNSQASAFAGLMGGDTGY